MKEFGSEFHISHIYDCYFDDLYKKFSYSTYLRTGREALLLAAKTIKGEKKILMPAYCCWSMEAPFRQEGYEIIYYRLNNNLSVDLKYIEYLLSKYKPTAVLTINYFGFTSTVDVVKVIKDFDSEISIVEDFSHCLFSFDLIFNPNVDYYIASIRKSVGVPDGAIYLSNNCTSDMEILPQDENYVFVRSEGEKLKTIYQYSAETRDKDSFYNDLSYAAKLLKDEDMIKMYQMSDKSRGIINHTYIDAVRTSRDYNYRHLYEIICENKCITLPFHYDNVHTPPFSLPILVKNRNEVQRILADNCVYAPVLWPINSAAAQICEVSQQFSNEMLALPIDQRYDYYDIEEIGRRINNYIK